MCKLLHAEKHHPFFLTSKYFLDLNVEMDKNQNTHYSKALH